MDTENRLTAEDLSHQPSSHNGVSSGNDNVSLKEEDFSIEKHHLDPGEMDREATPSCTLCFTMGTSFKLLQQRAGEQHEAQSNPGDLAIVPANTSSRWCWTETADILTVEISEAFVVQTAQQLESEKFNTFEVINKFDSRDPQLWNLAQLLQLETTEKGCGLKLYRDSLVTALTVAILKNHTNRTLSHPNSMAMSHPRIKQSIDYIHEHLTDDLSLKQLSRLAGISPNYFSSIFKQSLGISPHQYIIKCRVEKAKQLLLNRHELTVAEIAALTGFADQSHLSRHMRRRLGVCPREIMG